MKTTTRLFSCEIFLVSFVFCAIFPLTSQGEDLTTLDGHTFTNITEITKYPQLIVFTYNGDRRSAQNTNLPIEFREKYNVVIKTNLPIAVTKPLQPQLNPVDLFLFQNKESELYQLEMASFSTNDSIGIVTDKSWFIMLKKAEVDFTADTKTRYHSNTVRDDEDEQLMHFDIGQEDFISKMFGKFIEWDNVATTNHAEDFQKEIARRPINKSESDLTRELYPDGCVYTFVWQNGKSKLNISDSAPYSSNFEKTDVEYFQTLLKLLPNIKEKLSAAIRNKEAQQDLFK